MRFLPLPNRPASAGRFKRCSGTRRINQLLAMTMFEMLEPYATRAVYDDWDRDNLVTFAEPLSGKQCAQLLAAVTEARIDEYWSLRACAHQLANDAGESGLTVLQAASFCSYPKSSAQPTTSTTTARGFLPS